MIQGGDFERGNVRFYILSLLVFNVIAFYQSIMGDTRVLKPTVSFLCFITFATLLFEVVFCEEKKGNAAQSSLLMFLVDHSQSAFM